LLHSPSTYEALTFGWWAAAAKPPSLIYLRTRAWNQSLLANFAGKSAGFIHSGYFNLLRAGAGWPCRQNGYCAVLAPKPAHAV